MKFDNPNLLTFSWGREGLHVKWDGTEIGVVNITELSWLKIDYGSNLYETPAGWFCTRREKLIKWLTDEKQK